MACAYFCYCSFPFHVYITCVRVRDAMFINVMVTERFIRIGFVIDVDQLEIDKYVREFW